MVERVARCLDGQIDIGRLCLGNRQEHLLCRAVEHVECGRRRRLDPGSVDKKRPGMANGVHAIGGALHAKIPSNERAQARHGPKNAQRS